MIMKEEKGRTTTGQSVSIVLTEKVKPHYERSVKRAVSELSQGKDHKLNWHMSLNP
jgi:hypothetical protein